MQIPPIQIPRSMTRAPSKGAQRGMTLIEIIVVIVLIGGVLVVIGGQIFSNKDRAEAKLAKIQVDKVAANINMFEMDTGSFPGELDDLVSDPGVSGWLGPYSKESELKDPWGNAFDYRMPGDSGPFDLISLGKDGQPGGSSVDADIHHE